MGLGAVVICILSKLARFPFQERNTEFAASADGLKITAVVFCRPGAVASIITLIPIPVSVVNFKLQCARGCSPSLGPRLALNIETVRLKLTTFDIRPKNCYCRVDAAETPV